MHTNLPGVCVPCLYECMLLPVTPTLPLPLLFLQSCYIAALKTGAYSTSKPYKLALARSPGTCLFPPADIPAMTLWANELKYCVTISSARMMIDRHKSSTAATTRRKTSDV